MHADDTRPSVLRRVKDSSDAAAWQEFDAKYRALILGFCSRRGLQYADAEDVRQLTMSKLAQALRSFDYDPARGRFRSYLLRIVSQALHRYQAGRGCETRLDTGKGESIASDGAEDDAVWLDEWRRHHYRIALDHVRQRHDPRTMQVFERIVAGGEVAAVAADFGLSVAAVHKIKQRIRDQLSERIAAQIEDEDGPR